MRKDVTRSLLLWPSIASAMIAGIWLLQSSNAPVWQMICRQAKVAWQRAAAHELLASFLAAELLTDEPMWTESLALDAAPKLLHPQPPALVPNEQLVERADQGESAMKMPERLAESAATEILYAPRIDEARETAGLVVKSAGQVFDDAVEFLEDLLASDLVAAAQLDAEVLESEFADLDAPSLDAAAVTSSESIDVAQSTAALPHASSTGNEPMLLLLESIDYNDDDELRLDLPTQSTEIFSADAEANDHYFGVSINDIQSGLAENVNADAGKNAATHAGTNAGTRAPADQPKQSVLPSSIANLGDLAARHEDNIPEPSPSIALIDTDRTVKDTRRRSDDNPASWPLASKLNEQLELLASLALRESRPRENNQLVSTSSTASMASQWADQVADRLAAMRALDRLGNPRAAALLEELDQLAADGLVQAETTSSRSQQLHWLQTAYALARRIALWKPVFQLVRSTSKAIDLPAPIDVSTPVQEKVQRLRLELPETGDAEGWNRFLLLQEIEDAASIGDVEQRSIVAKRFMSRLQWHGLDPAHCMWLARSSINDLSDAVRPWTADAIDFAALLSRLEQKESQPTMLAEREITDAYQTLRFSQDPDAIALADAMNAHYRNANVRIAVSRELLRRFLPTVEPQTMPVRTTILGSRVRGISRMESDLDIAFQPAKDRWSLTVQAAGKVHTQSVGRNGPTAFNTSRDAAFVARTPIDLTKRDIQIGNPSIQVSGATRLRGIRTNYDGWPLFGSLVRSIAQSKYYESSGISNRIADRKMKTQLAEGISKELNQRLDNGTSQFEQLILGPLGNLRLDPMVVDLQTTEERLLARYRLAGDWQLGAFTPRPRAPSTSLMSLQVHQSSINNALEQMVPREESKPISRMIIDSIVLFGQPQPVLPTDIPDDVEVQFAKTRPITVDIEDGVFRVTLRVIHLSRGDQLKLSRFIVRADYRPEVDGLNAYLVRDGHLRISGPGLAMRERLPIRAIFNKVFSPSRKLPLTLPVLVHHPDAQDLAISQLEFRDGWIGMAISEQTAPRIAIRPAKGDGGL